MIFNTGLDICFFIPGMPIGRKEWAGETPLGGSETAAVEMARALAKRGHKIVFFCNTREPGEFEKNVVAEDIGNPPGNAFGFGTRIGSFLSCATLDLFVAQRVPTAMSHQTRMRRNWLWVHDLIGQEQVGDLTGVLWNVDSIVTVSQWMKDHYVRVAGVSPDHVFASRNGISLDLIDKARSEEVKRDHRLVLYAARPERGLDVLLGEVMPRLLRKIPDLRLAFCSYADAFNPNMDAFYSRIYEKAKLLGNSVQRLTPMPKLDLYRLHQQATLYLYPTNFSEVSCISCMESMALGNVFVCPPLAALAETMPKGCGYSIGPEEMGMSPEEAGVGVRGLDPFEIHSIARHPKFIELFVDKVVWLLTHPEGIRDREETSRRAQQHSRRLSWDSVAGDWEEEAERQFRRATKHVPRLVWHFLSEGDVVSAKRLLDEEGDESDPWTRKAGDVVNTKLDRLAIPERSREYYKSIGSNVPNVAYHAWKEPRFHEMSNWLHSHPEVRNLLDVGCAHGGYAVGLAKKEPGLVVVGVDVSERCIEAAHGFIQMELPTEERWRASFHTEYFSSYSDLRRFSSNGKGFDAVMAMEFVEHTYDPRAILTNLENQVKPGGWVLLTVPFGSWELESERMSGIPGCHLSSLDIHDLRDLVGKKPSFHMTSLGGGFSQFDELPKGWTFVEYQADHKPLGEVDWTRKRLLQRPRQTICLSMITSNSDAMLKRTLYSVRPFMDQAVVSDHQSKDNTRKILSEFNAEILEGPDPLSVGFDEARNVTLPHIHCDWVLWIDSDEEMLDTPRLMKFLRNSHHRGFSIFQHHFSAIPPVNFKPDIPIRVFRLREEDGTRIPVRWYGHIHEHPERSLNGTIGQSSVVPDAVISHDGYTSETKRRARFDRNFMMVLKDRARYPDRLLGRFFELRDCVHLVRYIQQKPEILLHPGIAAYINGLSRAPGLDNAANRLIFHAVRVGRTFLGTPTYVQREALDYYSEAVQMSGVGFKAFFGSEVLLNGASGPSGEATSLYWWASREDYETYAGSQMKGKLDVLSNKY